MKNNLIIFLLFILTSITAQNKKFSAEITPWYQDKQGAVSISFDDASYTQYKYAFPVLKNYGFKATFSLVGEWTFENPQYSAEEGMFEIKKMGWQQIRELQKNGNEIAAHGYKHKQYKKFAPVEQLTAEMKKIKELIEEKTQTKIFTLHYPYSFTSDNIVKATKKAGFLFGRTGYQEVVSNKNFNRFLLSSMAIINDTIPNNNEFKNWLDSAKGNWLILMYHHLFPKNSKEMNIMNYHHVTNTYSLFPETFEKQINMLSKKNYWVAPIHKIGKYFIERKNTKLRFRKICHHIKIKTYTDLDTSVYDQKLTLKIYLPWKKVKVKQNGNTRIIEIKDNMILIDFTPGEIIKLRKF